MACSYVLSFCFRYIIREAGVEGPLMTALASNTVKITEILKIIKC